MFDPQTVQIAVALIKLDQSRIALTWNDHWQAFVLPLTKLDTSTPGTTSEQAAVQSAAEVFHLPCRVVPGQSGQSMRKLQLSSRDGELKDYHFTVVPVEIHPDFRDVAVSHRPVIFVDVKSSQFDQYQPLSPSVRPILDACIEWGWV